MKQAIQTEKLLSSAFNPLVGNLSSWSLYITDLNVTPGQEIRMTGSRTFFRLIFLGQLLLEATSTREVLSGVTPTLIYAGNS